MTRLAELILNSPAHAHLLAAPPDPGAPSDAGVAADHIPVVAADNVSEFVFAGTPRENWEFGRDFPNCVPPFSPVFVELARPSRVVSGVHGLTGSAHLPVRWGWRIEATTGVRLLGDGRRAAALVHHFQGYADVLAASGLVNVPRVERGVDNPDPFGAAGRLDGPASGYFAAAGIVRALAGLKAPGARGSRRVCLGRLLQGSLVLEHDDGVVGPVATLDLVLDPGGRPVLPPLIDAFGGDRMSGAETAVLRMIILPLVFPALLALSFMNAEGVVIGAVEPTADLARWHAEQGLSAPVRYLVLDVAAVAGVGRN